LKAVLSDARIGRISAPIAWQDVPGDLAFADGGLRRYRDLESAYSKFKIEITGGETPALRALRDSMGR
jgi:hypothetical protein